MLDRRVTLRCLVEDLTSDWGDSEQKRAVRRLREAIASQLAGECDDASVARHLREMPRTNALNHPLIRQFDADFGPGADAATRESISGLVGPHWWKQKTSRWRGASTDHSMVGTDAAWLCAGGLRRQGDNDDFYEAFTRDVLRAGGAKWLPSAEDTTALRIDRKVLTLDAWKLQVHCSALALLGESLARPGEPAHIQFTGPSISSRQEAIGELSVTSASICVDGVEVIEVFLVAKIFDRSKIKAIDVAVQISRAALQDDAQEWRSTVYLEDAYAFSAIVDPVAVEYATELLRTGTLPAESTPSGLQIGLRAHYARRHGLVDAQVEGSAVESLCGYWFVPTSDHESVETCAECSIRLAQIPV